MYYFWIFLMNRKHCCCCRKWASIHIPVTALWIVQPSQDEKCHLQRCHGNHVSLRFVCSFTHFSWDHWERMLCSDWLWWCCFHCAQNCYMRPEWIDSSYQGQAECGYMSWFIESISAHWNPSESDITWIHFFLSV